MEFINNDIMTYATQYTQDESELLKSLNKETHQKILQPRMISGHFQGRFLSFVAKLIKPQKILEIGTFTGYATLCLAEGLTKDGEIHTIDTNEELVDFQKKYFDQSVFKNQIFPYLGEAKNIIPKLDLKLDLVFMDADKINYPIYLEMVVAKLKKGGVLIADNVLWSGKVLNKQKKALIRKLIVLSFLMNLLKKTSG